MPLFPVRGNIHSTNVCWAPVACWVICYILGIQRWVRNYVFPRNFPVQCGRWTQRANWKKKYGKCYSTVMYNWQRAHRRVTHSEPVGTQGQSISNKISMRHYDTGFCFRLDSRWWLLVAQAGVTSVTWQWGKAEISSPWCRGKARLLGKVIAYLDWVGESWQLVVAGKQ